MNTFLDANIQKSKSFILYGNLKDTVWCPDLIPRDTEHFLLKLLKSRGYEHIIFYGEAGTKGAYCLDEVSARFFFRVNATIPLPQPLKEGFEALMSHISTATAHQEPPSPTVHESSSEVSDALDALLDEEEEEYTPGNFSDETETFSEPEPEPEPQPEQPRYSSANIRYSYRGQVLSEFLQLIHPLMLKPDSHMAVVFYNILTTDFRDSSLKDDILDIWEKKAEGNLCLMLVPETMHNTSALETKIRQAGLESKFLCQIPNSHDTMLNPLNCLNLCQPNTDEIIYMMRYLSIVGTETGNKLRLDYNEITKLAEHIQYASGKQAGQSSLGISLSRQYMKEIYLTLSEYVDKNAVGGVLDLTFQEIEKVWNIVSDRGKALKELSRSGWESAFEKVTDALRIADRIKHRLEEQSPSSAQTICSADWGVQRFACADAGTDGERVPVPNFVILGSRGTGKTTIARLIGTILHEAGILKVGHTVEVNREQLTSSYVAGVPKATMARVNEAEEGVLFIDEAHALGRKDGGAEHSGTGVEVVSTLNAVMTNPNHHVSIILAGYEDEMKAVFDLDQGFRRRFGDNIIRLDDYPPEMLKDILVHELEKRNYHIAPDLTQTKQTGDTSYVPLLCMVDRIYAERNRKLFGNAGDMITLANYAEKRITDNIVSENCFYGGHNGTITKEYFMPMDIGATAENILSEMDEKFVGMTEAKDEMRRIGLELEDYHQNGMQPDEIQLKPIILVGNPGTGKTTLAHYLPQLYYHYHLLGTSQPLIVNASQLADKYQGGTQEKVLEYIRQAQESKGFLFVDEAHELLNSNFDGQGAFKAFMAPTTDKEKPFLACFAVYPDKLDAFLNLDAGAERRFRIIHLHDYTGEELYCILKRLMQNQGFRTDTAMDNLLQKVMTRVYHERTPRTGNAGNVENILSQMNDHRRVRCNANNIPFDSPESKQFLPEDIPEQLRRGLNCDSPLEPEQQLQEILESFSQNIVGMKNVRRELEEMVNEIKENIERGISPDKIPLRPLIFKGNSGTGKSMLAKIIGRIYSYFQVLHSETPVIVNASQLASRYSGGSQEIIHEYITQAQNKRACLFVDEAHQLLSEHFDGKGAFQAFMAPTADKDNPFLACFAVYPKYFDEFLGMDSGATSRFRVLELEDYTGEELLQIILLMMKKQGYTATEETCSLLKRHFDRVYQTRNERTGNARYAERLLEDMNRLRRKRCTESGIAFDTPESLCFVPEDIPEEIRKHLTDTTYGSNEERLLHIKEQIRAERSGDAELKDVLFKLVDAMLYQSKFPSHAKPVEPGHFFFKGSPGTGKTTSAEFFAKYLYELGIVQSPQPIVISASHLVGQYLGQTGIKTRERLENSAGRVLLIDEAYALSDPSEQASSYKRDAINELIFFLDNPVFRVSTSVIFCGYAHDLENLYHMNAGFKSRIHEVNFADFTPEQSLEVLQSMLHKEGLSLSEEAIAPVQLQIMTMHSCSQFSNGRTIRRYGDLLAERLQQRCIRSLSEYAQDDPRAFVILPEDIPETSVLYSRLNLSDIL